MYPVLFRIGSFEITSFGAMVAVAALVGLWLLRRELQRSGLPAAAADAGIVGVIAGLAGAKLLWTVEHAAEAPMTELLFARGGLSWYGGLIGGVGAGLAYIMVRGWPVVPILAAATPARVRSPDWSHRLLPRRRRLRAANGPSLGRCLS